MSISHLHCLLQYLVIVYSIFICYISYAFLVQESSAVETAAMSQGMHVYM